MLRDISEAYGLSLNTTPLEIRPVTPDTCSAPCLGSNLNDVPDVASKEFTDAESTPTRALDVGEEDFTSEDGAQVMFAAFDPGSLLTLELGTDSGNFNALVDTRASVSLTKLSIAERCGLVQGDRGVFPAVLGLGGTVINPVSVMDLTFTINSIKFTSPFTVVADNCLSYDIVLGGHFYTKHGLSIDINRQKISKHTNIGSWEIYLDETPTVIYHNFPIYLLTAVKLTSTEPVLVDAEVRGIHDSDQTDEFYYDGLVDDKRGRGVVGYQGIINLCNGKTSVLIESQTYGTDKKLKSGTCLGTVSTIVQLPEVNSAVETASEVLPSDIDLAHLHATEVAKMLDMMRNREAVFSKGDHDIGCTGLTQCKIELTDDTPIRFKPRRLPEPVANEIERQCDELLKLGVIEFSRSPYSAPILPIVKKDQTIRMCLDYRALNKVTKSDSFPVPNMGDLVFGLKGTEFFTSLDLVKGYYQVPLHPDSYECTAFSTAKNHYHFKRLSFGLKNAPGAFQREMQEILKDFDNKQVVVYIDDILIMSRTFHEHLALVGAVLGALIQHGVKIKSSRCSWFQSEVTFLGHVVGRDGIRKCDKYIKDVVDFPKPNTVKELRSFLGLVNFQRKFVPQCSVICKPLTKMMGLSDKTKINWDEDMNTAFCKLKDLMAEDVRLSYPDYSPAAPLMELSTDALKFGAGACLSQVQGGESRVIALVPPLLAKHKLIIVL